MNKIPRLIAHRGYSGRYPENTLLAYQAAYAYGNRWMECDIQLTADSQPFVHHDASLMRMGGIDRDIRQVDADQLNAYSAYYPERFGDEFFGNQFTSLAQLANWMKLDDQIRMFVEIKQESIDIFGLETCMDQVFKQTADVQNQCVIISFNHQILDYARASYGLPIGWVIPAWDRDIEVLASELQPEFLFSNKNLLPVDNQIWWQGVWDWAIYNVDQAQSALDWAKRGMQIIETNEIGALMRHPGFSRVSTS